MGKESDQRYEETSSGKGKREECTTSVWAEEAGLIKLPTSP